jgi:hypothetical protein
LPATAGLLRLEKADTIEWRNNANSADNILAVNSSDQLTFNGSPIQPLLSLTDGEIWIGDGTNTPVGRTLTGDVTVSDLGVTAIGALKIVNAQISASAAIAYTKLALTGSIVNNDINGSASIAYSKLALAGSIVNADIYSAAAIAVNKLAALTASSNVRTDGSGFLTTGAIDLSTTDVTGNLGVTHLASGTSASSSTFWRGDGSWAAPAVGLPFALPYLDTIAGDVSNVATANSVLQVDIAHASVGINSTPDTGTTYGLISNKAVRAPYFAPDNNNGIIGVGDHMFFKTGGGDSPTNMVFQTNVGTPFVVLDSTHGTMAIGNAVPDISSILDLVSTNKGFLPPVMTTTQEGAISTPAEGLIVYDSTLHNPAYYNGSAWVNFGTDVDNYLALTGGTLTGDLTLANQHAIIFKELTANGTTAVTLEAPATVTGSYTLTLPPAVASANQVLTDVAGNGILSWTTPTGSGTVNAGTQYQLAYYATSTNAVSGLTLITANRVLLSDANGLPVASSVTNTTLGYLDATSSIQTQLNSKVATTAQHMLQIVSATTTTSTTTTSSTFQATALTANITPTSASSKILIQVSGVLEVDVTLSTANATISRGGTNLGGSTGFMNHRKTMTGLTAEIVPASAIYLDSPATTSTLTYAVYLSNNDNASSVTWGESGTTTLSIVLTEVQ